MERELMKHAVLLVATALMLAASASAQEEVGTATATTAAAEPAPAPTPAPAPAKKEKKSIYKKKVGSLLWLEGFAGPSTYDPDDFGSVDLTSGSSADAPKLKGPEYGASLGVGLGGFVIGGFFRMANYSDYKLTKVGVDMQGVFRFIPYVHPMLRIDLFYATTGNGDPFPGVTNTSTNGGGVTLGAGLRIPVIKWISIAITFDWSVIGLAVQGDDNNGNSVNSGVAGQQFAGTFALTFHFIQKRKGN
jgi:hypothetical protein